MAIGIEDLVTTTAAVQPDPSAPVHPGDLTRYAPIGLGMAAPMVLRPWDDPFAPGPGRFYGAEPHSGDPLADAPRNDATGGVVYLDATPDTAALTALLQLLGVNDGITTYAAFIAEAAEPSRQRFLAQLRIMEYSALTNLYGITGTPVQQQPLTAGELIFAFIEAQQRRWGTRMGGELSGMFGGDGDWAVEQLAFGFMVENASWSIYRIWSHAWLVTK